jgi:hypothetical protein
MMKPMFLLVCICSLALATNEGPFGHYTSVAGDTPISFTIDEHGIRDLHVDRLEYDTSTLTYDYLGVYGNSRVLHIAFSDSDGFDNTIKLFIVTADGSFVLAGGYYLRSRFGPKGDLMVDRKCVVELSYRQPD